MSAPTVSFDLDGVLIRNPFASCVVPRLLAHLRSTMPRSAPALDAARLGALLDAEWASRQRSGRWVAGYDWDDIYRVVAEHLGASAPPDVAAWVRDCCTRPGAIALLPGAADAVRGLAQANVRTVVITNGFAKYQAPVLDALGLLDAFAEIRAPDRTGVAKPDPNVFSGLENLVAHVGDMPSHDVLAARRAGAPSILVRPRRAPPGDPYDGLYGPVDPSQLRADAIAEDAFQAARIALAWIGSRVPATS